MQKNLIILTLSMLLSVHPDIQARYVNYDRAIQVIAKLKALEKNSAQIEMCKKQFESKYSRLLLPRDYNALNTLMIELLNTAEQQKLPNQQEMLLNVLHVIDDELMGLINRYGYSKELIALSYKTTSLHAEISKGAWLNPIYAAERKRLIQDLLAQAIMTDVVFEAIQKYQRKQLLKADEQKAEEKKVEPVVNKESHVAPEPDNGTDAKYE